MKSLRGLVLRYIWKNKIRTVMTIIAVAISAFIIFTIFSFGKNILHNQKVNAYRDEGGWDASYIVSRETAGELLKLKGGEVSDISDEGCGIDNLYISAYSKGVLYVDDMSFFKGIELEYGKYPQKSGEMMVPLSTLDNEYFINTPHPQLGRRVKIRDMVTVGVSEEEYETLEKDLKLKLAAEYLEYLKENAYDDYEYYVENAEKNGLRPEEYCYPPKSFMEPVNELYEKYHENVGRDVLISGVFDNSVDTEREVLPGIEKRIFVLLTDEGVDEDGNIIETRDIFDFVEMRRYSLNSLLDLPVELMDFNSINSELYKVTVMFDSKKDIRGQARLLGERIGSEPIVNSAAIVLYESTEMADDDETFMMAFSMLIAGVFGLIVMVIVRNSFNISVNERENDYGMYRCIGLTRRQILKMVLFEALIVGVIGTLIGVFLGTAGGTLLFNFLNNYHSGNSVLSEFLMGIGKLHFYFMWKAFGMTVIYMVFIVGYSMISPIEKLYRMSPVTALKNKDGMDKKAIKRLNRKRRKSQTKKGIFGYPEWYGFNNTRQRKGRFYLLVITLAVCFGAVTMVANLMKTIINTELNNQMKPSITVDGLWDESMEENFGDMRMSIRDVERLEDGLAREKGFISLEYSSYTVRRLKEEAMEDESGANPGNVDFLGLSDRYYNDVVSEIGGIDSSSEEGVRNIIIIRGKTEDDSYLTELRSGDDITLFRTKFHVAGVINSVMYEKLAERRFPEQLTSPYSPGTLLLIYLKDSDEPVISEEAIKADASGNAEWFSDYITAYIYVDLFKDNGSIESYLENNSYLYMNDDIGYKGMGMIKSIVYAAVTVILLVVLFNLINIRSSDILNRRSEIRLIRKIGFSRREVRRAILSEGLLVGADAVMIGAVFGTGFAYMLARAIYTGNGMLGNYNADYMSVRFGIDWTVFLVTALVIFFINIISGVIALSMVRDDYK